MTKIKVLGLGGSANPNSPTTLALERALEGARDAGAEVRCFDVQTMALPMFEYGITTPAAEALIAATREAQGLIWCSPLYHGSISGAFKNALDWFEILAGDERPYLTDKVVGLIATATGEQALQAINSMEYIVRALRGWTLPLTAPVLRSDRAFDEQGMPRDPALGKRLHTLGRQIVRAASLWAG